MVPAISINYWAVLAAAVASMVLGFLWYGPLFGKVWIKLMNFDKKQMEQMKKKGMGKIYTLMVINTLVVSYILAHFIKYLGTTVPEALQTAFWLWLGFIATVMLGSVLWEGKSWKLYSINAAYWLVNLAVMSAILALWV